MIKSIENLAKRKKTGGIKTSCRGRRAHEIDRYAAETLIGDDRRVKRRVRASSYKVAIRTAGFANVLDKSVQKIIKSKIIKANANKANRDYERRKIITKGALIETEQGTARVTSRPGQDGVINAVLTK